MYMCIYEYAYIYIYLDIVLLTGQPQLKAMSMVQQLHFWGVIS